MSPDYVIFASGGNDSIALVWYAYTEKLPNVIVAYSNTGWSASWWPLRMAKFKAWIESLGFSFAEIPSIGMEALVHKKSGWPANGMQFCTTELKIEPAKAWLDRMDPEKLAMCMVGIRREESPRRLSWPALIPDSENHGGRDLWAPLIALTEFQRNQMVCKAGWEVLPHRSKECSPCVNANRDTFRNLETTEIERVRRIEQETGKTMFRPHRFHGARGIDSVLRWARSPRGRFNTNQLDLGCDSGMCAS